MDYFEDWDKDFDSFDLNTDLTDEELADFSSRAMVQLEPALTQQLMRLIAEVARSRGKK